MSEIISEMEHTVGAQFRRIDTLVDFMVRTELGPLYQAREDANALQEQEDELLTDRARALTQLIRENEKDARAQEHFGVESYSQLSEGQRVEDLVLYAPFMGSATEERVHQAISDQQDEITEQVRASEAEISNVTLYIGGLSFTDIEEGVTYSVSSDGQDDPLINVSVELALPGSSHFPPSAPQPQGMDRILALGRVQEMLDAIEDVAVALIHPANPQA